MSIESDNIIVLYIYKCDDLYRWNVSRSSSKQIVIDTDLTAILDN